MAANLLFGILGNVVFI